MAGSKITKLLFCFKIHRYGFNAFDPLHRLAHCDRARGAGHLLDSEGGGFVRLLQIGCASTVFRRVHLAEQVTAAALSRCNKPGVTAVILGVRFIQVLPENSGPQRLTVADNSASGSNPEDGLVIRLDAGQAQQPSSHAFSA